MGIYDREYYRREGPSFLGSISAPARVCRWLIGINVVVFLIQLATVERLPEVGLKVGVGAFTKFLWLEPSAVLHGEVWRLVTGAFLHSTQSPLHIFFNMIILWWAGSQLEEIYGSKEFLALYLASAVISSLAYTATMFADNVPAVGASGAVMATLVLFACHFPHRTILLMFVIPVPVWLLAVGYMAYDFFTWTSGADTSIGVTAHLGGGLFGFLYYKMQWRIVNLWPDLKGWKRRRARPPLRVYREEEEPPRTPVAVAAPAKASQAELDEHLEAKLDAVLEKMSQVGKENLTEDEREVLLRASEIYRKRRT